MPEGRVFHFSVDLDKELQKTILHDIFVTENRNAHTFRVKITRSGAAVDLSGASVSGTFSRYKTRETVEIPSGSVEGEFVVLTMPPECYNIKTTFCLIINVAMGGMTLSVFAGEGNMLLNRFDRIDNTGGVIPSLGELLAQIDAMKTATDRANAGADRVEQLQIDASGLAGDALKLGGKPPEAYAAVDLLDNSNFEIAQAGYGGFHGSTKYAADRWQANNHDGTTYQMTSVGLTVTSSAAYEGQIMQVVADTAALVGKTLTYAVKGLSEFGKLGMLAYCYDANDDIVQRNFLEPNFSELTVRTITFTVPANTAKIRCYINNRAADTYTVEWAALYEGAYTVGTLPPYVPKGYVVELAECRRYYREMKYLRVRPYNVSAATRYYRINIEPPMRLYVNPTVQIVDASETPLNSWVDTGATFAFSGTAASDSFTINATGNNSATDFVLAVDVKLSSDL